MKTWKIVALSVITVIATALILFFVNTPKVTATDTIDMAYFNKTIEELKTTISTLETTTNEKITTLENKNAELEKQIDTLKTKVNELEEQVNNNYSTLNNKIIKIEAREDKLYTTFKQGYTNLGIYLVMTQFKEAQ